MTGHILSQSIGEVGVCLRDDLSAVNSAPVVSVKYMEVQVSNTRHFVLSRPGQQHCALISLCNAGDDDEDEIVPLKLKETKRHKDRQVIGLEIGGQMTFILSTTKTESAPAPANAAHGLSHTPPEPAPADGLI